MAIIKIKGGLGNQMFQYSLGRSISINRNIKLTLDTLSYSKDEKREFELDNYNVKYKNKNNLYTYGYCMLNRIFTSSTVLKLLGIMVEQNVFLFNKEILSSRSKYFDGYWQNPEYFSENREVLMEELRYKGFISEEQRKLIEIIRNENSVAIHIRRGDYLDKSNKSIYNSIGLDYYKKSIAYLESKFKVSNYYIFSDDIKWCKNHFKKYDNIIFIDHSISNSHHIDLVLMKNCRHFIIANSSFSWWAAWLSDNHDKTVISPKDWYKNDILNINVIHSLPDKWIKI